MRLRREAGLRGRLLRRYKRFFADVETRDGRVLTVHCPNPGSMLGCAPEGAAVGCSTHDSPHRKLPYTLEMVRIGRAWVGVHTGRANAVVEGALRAGAVAELAAYREIRREVRLQRSRIDFLLSAGGRDHPEPAWLEVKSVTLAEGRLARFPDSVTERGRRHLEELMQLRSRGARALLLFLVQRADCDAVAPADSLDPAYGRTLRRAAEAGVELIALGARVTAREIAVERRLPVLL